MRPAVPRELVRHAGGQSRVVEDDGAGANHDGIDVVTEQVGSQPRLLPGDPATVAGAGGNPPIERHRVLGQYQWPSCAHVREEAGVEVRCLVRQQAEIDLDARVTQPGHPAAVH